MPVPVALGRELRARIYSFDAERSADWIRLCTASRVQWQAIADWFCAIIPPHPSDGVGYFWVLLLFIAIYSGTVYFVGYFWLCGLYLHYLLMLVYCLGRKTMTVLITE